MHLLTPIRSQARAALRWAVPQTPGGARPPQPVTGSAAFDDPGAALSALGRPLRQDTAERKACEALYRQGRDMARQDRWEDLSDLVRARDVARAVTASGAPQAEILAAGARSDLGRALYAASAAGALSSSSRLLEGLEALDDTAAEMRDNPHCAALVALAHMDAGWAWYRQGWQRGRPEQNIRRFRAAFARAEAHLAPHDARQLDAPLIASARCALLPGRTDADARVVDAYRDLIALAPQMPGHMRAFGLHLLPCWFGGFETLEAQARQVAAATKGHWGAGGYAWVYMDALTQSPECFKVLDAGLLLDGIDDILARMPRQHMVNLMAAYLSAALDRAGPTGLPRSTRRLLTTRRDRLIRDVMTETHEWVWSIADTSYATPGAHLADETGGETGARRALRALAPVLPAAQPG